MEEQKNLQQQAELIGSCPVCQSSSLHTVIELKQIPILCNLIWNSREEALSAPRGDVELAFCDACGHLFNRAFDPDRMEYDQQYENSLHFSPRFQKYATALAHYLVDQYNLRGKSIIEIGSGRGDFLKLLCEYGGNVGTGFDPSYSPSPEEKHSSISFIRDLYTARYSDYQADFICSRHTLEHIEHPDEFVKTLRKTIGDRKRTPVFIEVPNVGYILRDTAIWDIIYEHFSYFSAHSLASLFSRNGFNVLKVTEAYENQFLSIEVIPRDVDKPSPNAPYPQPAAALLSLVQGFSDRAQSKIDRWKAQIDQMDSDGKRVVLWGAGSKGISFLNMLQIREQVEYIIDINPRKREKYVTGSGQQIVPPEFLKDYQPDTVIIMNPIYQQEIEKTIAAMGLSVDILTA